MVTPIDARTRPPEMMALKATLLSSCIVLSCAAMPTAMAQDSTHAAADDASPELLPKIVVQGNVLDANPYADPMAPYKVDRLSSSKFTEPLLDTPRTVTVLTKEALEDKGATTLRDALRSTAGVTLGSGEGGNAFGDRFFIRGFDARNDVFVDGVRDPGVGIRENFNTEQVEILRGPASSFAGRGTTGGALNVVTKAASDVDFTHIDADVGTASMKRGTFDINRSLSPELDVRVNGMAQNADVPGRKYATDNRNGLAVAVTYKPSSNVTVKAGYSYTHLWGLPDFGVPYDQVNQRPVTEGEVPRDTYYGAINRDHTKSTQSLGTFDVQWKVDDAVTLENNARASHSLLDYIGTIAENPSATNPVTAPYASSRTHFSGYVQLNAQSRHEPVTVVADQPQAIFRFDTGAWKHTAVVGGELSSEKIRIDTYSHLTSELTTGPVAFTSSGAPIVSVYDPINYIYGSRSPALTGNPLIYKVDTKAGYAMDTANYNDVVIANAGIRYDDYRITAANNASMRKADTGITSYNVGLVVKPAANGSIYAAYATSADPVGDELDATTSTYGGLSPTQNATQIYGAQKSKAAEIGTKWEMFDRHLLATASVFQTKVTNARETAPANLPGYASGQIVAGAAYRVRGLDFELAGNITDQWSVLGGAVFMKSDIQRSIVPTNVGLQLANIAHQSFNLMTKYQVTNWLEIGGQTIYASQIKGGSLLAANGGVAYPNAPNPTLLPSYWRFDAFVEARVSDHLTLKLYGQNIFNKTYYDSLYQSAQPFIAVAPGRSVTLSATLKF